MLWAQLGPLGSLVDLPEIAPGLQVAPTRPNNMITTLGGRQYSQYAPLAPRTWTAGLDRMTPADAAYLRACAQGAVPGPLYLVTSDALVANMMPPHLAIPGMGGDTTLGAVSPSTISVATGTTGSLAPYVGVVSTASAGAWSPIVPIRDSTASISAFFQCWAARATSMTSGTTALQVQAVTSTGTLVGSIVNVTTTTTGTQSRATASLTLGTTVAGIQVRTVASAGITVTGLRLTEGSDPGVTAPVPGEGVLKVTVTDPQPTVQVLSTTTGALSDWSFTILEEG